MFPYMDASETLHPKVGTAKVLIFVLLMGILLAQVQQQDHAVLFIESTLMDVAHHLGSDAHW